MDNKANNTIVIVHIIIYDHNIIVTSYACNDVHACSYMYNCLFEKCFGTDTKLLITLENAAAVRMYTFHWPFW